MACDKVFMDLSGDPVAAASLGQVLVCVLCVCVLCVCCVCGGGGCGVCGCVCVCVFEGVRQSVHGPDWQSCRRREPRPGVFSDFSGTGVGALGTGVWGLGLRAMVRVYRGSEESDQRGI